MDFTTKYRPSNFSEIVGNQDILEILKGILQQENTPHSYLFTGPYGCGKTTLARIFAEKLNCDIIEYNSSNNRGIDTAREIQENCRFKSLTNKNKIYILDEVHRLTKDFQNAILKVLEEPPVHVYFILCTTDPQGLLKTVKSRCIQIIIEKSTVRDILNLLDSICKKENKDIERKILKKIAVRSNGHVRDAIKLLEKIINIENKEQIIKIIEYGNINENDIEIIELCRKLLNGTWKEVQEILKKLKDKDTEKIRRIILSYMSTVLLNSGNKRAGFILSFFIDNFYDSGYPELILACFSCFN